MTPGMEPSSAREIAVAEARLALLESVRVEDIIERVSPEVLGGAFDQADLRAYLTGYFAEVDLGVDLISSAVRRWESSTGRSNPRILEIGSGLGLVHRILGSANYDVTGLEPSGLGFEYISAGLDIIDELAGTAATPLIRGRAEELADLGIGSFDVICSTYVLEHVPSVSAVLRSIGEVLNPDGISLHLMPNYRVPFDPHFGVPVNAPTAKIARKAFAPLVARHPELWESLNFVTARSLERAAAQCGMDAQFDPGVMAETVSRLLDEPSFAARHRHLATVARWGNRVGMLSLIRRWPARFATPMRTSVSHSANVAESRHEHG